MDNFVKSAGQLQTQLMGLLQNRDVSIPLLAALAAGGAGGFLSARTPERPGEDRKGRRKRIIRSALLSALAGGGATALGMQGLDQLGSVLPEGTKNPASGAGTLALRGAGAGGSVWGVDRYARKGHNRAAQGLFADMMARAGKDAKAQEALGKFLEGSGSYSDKFRSLYNSTTMNNTPVRDLISHMGVNDKVQALAESMGLDRPGPMDRAVASMDRMAGGLDRARTKLRDGGWRPFLEEAKTRATAMGQDLPGRLRDAAPSSADDVWRAVKRHPRLAAGTAAFATTPLVLGGAGSAIKGITPNILGYD